MAKQLFGGKYDKSSNSGALITLPEEGLQIRESQGKGMILMQSSRNEKILNKDYLDAGVFDFPTTDRKNMS